MSSKVIQSQNNYSTKQFAPIALINGDEKQDLSAISVDQLKPQTFVTESHASAREIHYIQADNVAAFGSKVNFSLPKSRIGNMWLEVTLSSGETLAPNPGANLVSNVAFRSNGQALMDYKYSDVFQAVVSKCIPDPSRTSFITQLNTYTGGAGIGDGVTNSGGNPTFVVPIFSFWDSYQQGCITKRCRPINLGLISQKVQLTLDIRDKNQLVADGAGAVTIDSFRLYYEDYVVDGGLEEKHNSHMVDNGYKIHGFDYICSGNGADISNSTTESTVDISAMNASLSKIYTGLRRVSDYNSAPFNHMLSINKDLTSVELNLDGQRFNQLTDTGRETIGYLNLMESKNNNYSAPYGEHRVVRFAKNTHSPNVFGGALDIRAFNTVKINVKAQTTNAVTPFYVGFAHATWHITKNGIVRIY